MDGGVLHHLSRRGHGIRAGAMANDGVEAFVDESRGQVRNGV